MISPRPHVQAIPACPHGSIGDAELARLGLQTDDVVDFSASTNPLGPPPSVAKALAFLSTSRYPDDGAALLREAIARAATVPTKNVVVGNGSAEIIWLLALAYLAPGDHALIVGPTFGEYARAVRVVGAAPFEVRARPARFFQPSVTDVVEAITAIRPRLVFLCNPNNPTGALLRREEIREILTACSSALLVVDEAYRAFCDEAPELRDDVADGSIFLLRSMTKDYALAGLRLGYGLGAEFVVDALNRVRPPWNVSAAAQVAGLAALADREHLERSRATVAEARSYLVHELNELGLSITPPSANFLLVKVGDGKDLRSRLLRRGVCVRDCASFGLPEYVRIGVRTLPECARLVEAIHQEYPNRGR